MQGLLSLIDGARYRKLRRGPRSKQKNLHRRRGVADKPENENLTASGRDAANRAQPGSSGSPRMYLPRQNRSVGLGV